jgi:hypothetical protein
VNESRDRIEAPSAEEERELRAVAALLRDLPDPQPPEDLVARVMGEVRRRESGPRVLRVAFRRFEPMVATALAAGVGALVLTTAIESGLFPPGEPPASATGLQPSVAHRVADASPVPAARLRRSLDPRSTDPVWVALPGSGMQPGPMLGMTPSTPLGASLGVPAEAHASRTNPMDRHLDRDLNSLLLDPPAFYARIQRMEQSDRFVARLADRAARRGDAAEVALRLRQRSPEHPQTSLLVDRLLRASLARSVPQQR